MAYDQIKESIKAVIKENGNYEITGNVLQAVYYQWWTHWDQSINS